MTTPPTKDIQASVSKWILPSLLSLLVGVLSLIAQDIRSDVTFIKEKVTELALGQSELQTKNTYIEQEQKELNQWLDELDKRVQQLEKLKLNQ